MGTGDVAAPIHRNSLKPGYMLHWYRIERVLGQGGFGITYLACDDNLVREFAIKEYMPLGLAVREQDSSVQPASDTHAERFKWGLDRFMAEARTLYRFNHPNIVRVLTSGEANGTGYMVMEYEHGESLKDILDRRQTLEEDELLHIVLPLLGGLEKVHESGFIHRDIKPANIMIREDGSPVLIDFGSARQALGATRRTLTALVSPGYAPFEQYFGKGEQQGPWTDIYGLGATLYRAVTGKPPEDAVDRGRAILDGAPDTLEAVRALARGRYSAHFLEAIDHALRFRHQDRPQSIAEWRREFGARPDNPLERRRGNGARMGTTISADEQRSAPEPPKLRSPGGRPASVVQPPAAGQGREPARASAPPVSPGTRRPPLPPPLPLTRRDPGLPWASLLARHKRLAWGLGVLALAGVIVLAVVPEGLLPQIYIAQINGAVDDVPKATGRTPRRLPGHGGDAEERLARYWDRRAQKSELEGQREAALLYRLQALAVVDENLRRTEASQLIGADYQRMLATYRHGSGITAVAFSPEGDRVLTGSDDNIARLWDARSGKPLGEPLRHEHAVWAVAFSPDGDRVLTGSDDNTARLWDARSGKPLGEPLRHKGWLKAVAFSPEGGTVYTATDRWLRRFDLGRDPLALIPRSSRLLSGTWAGGMHFLRHDGGRLQVALHGAAADAVRIETLDLDQPDAPPLPGDPQNLLAEWQQKLALTLAPDGRIVPTYPVETPKPEAPAGFR